MSKKDPFDGLFANVRRMGAALLPPRPPMELNDWQNLASTLTSGIEIDPDDLDDSDEFGGLLGYKGMQVLLYIPDHGHYFESAMNDPENANRYHVANCSTIQDMRRKIRIKKYTATTNRDRKFDIFGSSGQSKHTKGSVDIKICRNCLRDINYKGYASYGQPNRNTVVRDFDRDEFFQTYSTLFPFPIEPLRRMTSGYPDNWNKISVRYRHSKDYTCEDCGVDLGNYRKLLHTHHINGVKSDVSDTNLRALCVDCHRRQPFHDHMKVVSEDIRTIRIQRRKLGIDVPKNWNQVFQLADPAFHGSLHKLRNRYGNVLPRIAYYVEGMDAEIEVCWPNDNFGVVSGNRTAQLLRAQGWKVKTLSEVLS